MLLVEGPELVHEIVFALLPLILLNAYLAIGRSERVVRIRQPFQFAARAVGASRHHRDQRH
jgi:hypothetical protein